MLDIKFIRENSALVKKIAKEKRVEVDIDKLLKLDEKRRAHIVKLEGMRAQQRKLGSGHKGKPPKEIMVRLKELSDDIKVAQEAQNTLDEEYQKLLWTVPNIVHESVPHGKDESENKIVRKVGKHLTMDFHPKEHWELGAALGIIDIVHASEVSGARFAYLKGKLALLQFALINFALSVLTDEKKLAQIAKDTKLKVSTKPFTAVIPPVLMRPEIMHQMGRLEPREERYHIESDDLYLVGSAEHTLGPMYMGKTLAEKELPLRYVGFSTAFRREAGSYGKDTKGIFSVHQFDKLELESFTLPENSLAEQDLFVTIQEHLMQTLELPYQVVLKCTGDMGAPDYREFDIETWIPSQKRYRETHTSDLMTDYQSRRLNTKVKRSAGQNEFVH